MKKYYFFNLFLVLAISTNAQTTFNTTILNKEGLYSHATILQDYDGDSDLDIIATEIDPDQLIWLENDPTKQFPKRVIISSGISLPSDVDATDVDNDGDQDYVICSGARPTGFTGELSWFQRQLDNSYIKYTIVPGKDYDKASIADFDADGFMDIVAVGFNQSSVQIFINDGNLSFTPNTIHDVGKQAQIDELAIEDIDEDGDIDIIFGNGIDQGRLYINDGRANFTRGAELFAWNDLSASAGHSDIEIADLNNDGKKDIVTFTGAGTGGLYFLDGANSYDQSLIDREGVDNGGDLIIADLDNNGLLDIVRQHWTSKFISILYQVAPLQFEKEHLELNWDSEQDGSQMSVGDLDGDGDLDLVVPDGRTIDRDLSWFENLDGKLYRHYLYSKLIGARIPKLADFDNDGDLDIFLTVTENLGPTPEDEVILFENIDGANFINWRLHDAIDYPADIELADVDKDGDLDAFVTALGANTLVWLRNDRIMGNWSAITIDETASAPIGIAAVDFDNDGDTDVALCSSGDAKVYWYQNNGSGTFTRNSIDTNLPSPTEIEAGDFNSDEDIDFVVISTEQGNAVTLYTNNGNGAFAKQVIYSEKPARDVEIGDWNNDGDTDIVTSVYDDVINPSNLVDVVLLDNNGSGSFTTSSLVTEGGRINGIKLYDMDRDNDLDLIISNERQNFPELKMLSIGFNNNGALEELVPLSDLNNGTIYGIDAGNTNDDNKPEIVYADFNSDDLVLVNLELPLSLNRADAELQSKVQVYPNPTFNSVTIRSTSADLRLKNYSIFDTSGKVVDQGILSETGKINLHGLSNHTYFILIHSNKGIIPKKLIKQ